MIPTITPFLTAEYSVAAQPSKTYRLYYEKNKIAGFVDGLAAIRQAVFLMLAVPYGKHEIYPNYGIELDDLYGMPMAFVQTNIPMRVKDALSVDERITDVKNFAFERSGEALKVNFTVVCEAGSFETGMRI